MNVIDKIFEIENDEKLLSYRTKDDIPVFMMGKYYLLLYIISTKVLDRKISQVDRTICLNAFGFLFRAGFHNLINNNDIFRKKIIFYATSRKTLMDNKYFNRYMDFFALQYPELSGCVEKTLTNWGWPFPRENDNVIFDGPARTLNTLKGKIFGREDCDVIYSMCRYYFERAERILDIDLSVQELDIAVKAIQEKTELMRGMAKWFDNHISQTTKMIIMTEGGLPDTYPLNYIMKRRGIIPVDLQHGFILDTSFAYHFGNKIKDSKYVKNGLPGIYLTYGDWWNTQINTDITKVSIGNPYREYCISQLKNNIAKKEHRILIIGCGMNTERYIQLAYELSKKITSYKIVFRPHVNERKTTMKVISKMNYEVDIDEYTEIYESLNVSNMVIAELSTVLFESIGIVDKIVVLKTEYSDTLLPKHPFLACKTADDIISLLKDDFGNKYFEAEQFWKSNWRLNYKHFLKSYNIL